MNKLKRLAITESNGLYTLSGHYRKCGDTMYGDERKHYEEVLAVLPRYDAISTLARRYSQAGNVPLFDLTDAKAPIASVPLVESYAKMKGE